MNGVSGEGCTYFPLGNLKVLLFLFISSSGYFCVYTHTVTHTHMCVYIYMPISLLMHKFKYQLFSYHERLDI